jgi:hypothetical protein
VAIERLLGVQIALSNRRRFVTAIRSSRLLARARGREV